MIKANVKNPQSSLEYALYMIASSYFDECTVTSKRMEEKLFLYYCEEKADNQYLFEDMSIRYMDSLKKKLPEDFFKRKVNVKILKHKDFPTEIVFSSPDMRMSLICEYAGKKSRIFHRIRIRKKPASKKQAA